ncbi:MAG: biopolymer transporter ExbD [Kiritimatiellae bacterium]|nr:biopolymer transporter ExbD [Verrucomicrobiota bacterium]MCG2680325.1 biopolymer transporter ExbD [Kiritimatiellia bacterium]
MTPMIDAVFLLLIFFMITTTLGRKESDLGITLPGMMDQGSALEMPDEQIIEVQARGEVVLNGKLFEGKEMPELVKTLTRYRLSSEAANNRPMITVQAEDGTSYDRVIDVLNACAGASITNVTFGAI